MELVDYISKDRIGIDPGVSIIQIIELFNTTSYTHIPVFSKEKWIANVAKEDLLGVEDKTQRLENVAYLYESFFANEDEVLLEVVSNFAINNTNMLPVLNKKKEYVGYLDLNDMLDCFADTVFLNSDGSILLLEKNTNAYAMSEVCQIVEANNNVVLGCFVSEIKEDVTLITLKVRSVNVNELIQSFRRYDYTILNNLTEDSYLEGLKKRSDYFFKYLNI